MSNMAMCGYALSIRKRQVCFSIRKYFLLAKMFPLILNLFWLFDIFRSSTVPRSDPSPSTSTYHLKCFICRQFANKVDRQKYRISEGPWTEKLMEAVKFLMDDVYTRICDLEDPNSIFVADLFYHRNCFPDYIFK